MTNEIVPWFDGVLTLDANGTGLSGWINTAGNNGTFSNITAFTQGYYEFSSLDQGIVSFRLTNNTAETLNIEITSVSSITDDDLEGPLVIRYPEVAYFNIHHMTNYDISSFGDVIIEAIYTNSSGVPYIMPEYTGTITIFVIGGTPSTIDWATNSSANGVLVTNSGADAVYTYSLLDNGVVTLLIRDDTMETINIDIADMSNLSIRDSDFEGPLHFFSTNLYILSMSVPRNSYATVGEVNSLTILFSRLVDPDSVRTNIFFYDSDLSPYTPAMPNQSFSLLSSNMT